MKILALRGKNLASLAGEFEVDFEQEPLRSAGLFAISGPTGAGKSTLLDALCMALYEDTPRLTRASGNKTLPDGKELISQQDTANLLRRGAGEGYAEVDFVGNDGHSYRARWSIRRSRNKAGGSLQPTTMSLHQLPALLPIGGKKTEVKEEIVQRIGLKFEQFTRAVLLAQNEFSSFLKADDNERGELLETLTGSAIYSELSRRAFERAKEERAALERFHARLADNKPLSEEERTALDIQIASASEQLQQRDAQLAAIDLHLRWHQETDKLAQQEQAALRDLQEREQQQAASAARQQYLQRVEAVQAARPLQAEVQRLHASIADDQAHIRQAQQQLETATHHHALAQSAQQEAQTQLQIAEQAQTAAAPQLDQAKALDAKIETLLPAHQARLSAKAQADLALAQARADRSARQNTLAVCQKRHRQTALWLQQHAPLYHLAAQWPAWDVLFRQADSAQREVHQHQQQIQTLNANHNAQQSALQEHADALQNAQASVDAATQERTAKAATLAGFDLPALQTRKKAAEQQRNELVSASQLLQNLSALEQRAAQLQTQIDQSALSIHQADAAAAHAETHLPAASAALQQAERALKAAETACAANVEDLRAQLQDDAPCPVCGATEHPYAAANPQLHALLLDLQAQLQTCRQQEQSLRDQLSQQRSIITQQTPLLAQQRQDAHALQQQKQTLQTQWQQHPLYASAATADDRSQWLAQQQADNDQRIAQLQDSETHYHQALQARDAAQAAWDNAHQQFNQIRERHQAASTALTQLLNERERHTQQVQLAQAHLQAHLEELAAAFAPVSQQDADWQTLAQSIARAIGDDAHNAENAAAFAPEASTLQDSWRELWQAAPAAFHQDCETRAQQWISQRHAFQQAEQERTGLQLALENSEQQVQQIETQQLRSAQELAASDQTLQATQQQRQNLFNGAAVATVSAGLATAVHAAKTRWQQQSEAANTQQQNQVRSSEALTQAHKQLTQHQQDAVEAQARLAQWLTGFNQIAEHETGEALSDEALRALLLHDNDWIHAERHALQTLRNATQHAASVLQERRQQSAAHQAHQPAALPEEDHSAEDNESDQHPADNIGAEHPRAATLADLQQRAQTWRQQRQQAQHTLSQYQLAAAQDEARRTQVASLLQDLQAQENRQRIWAQLNELIGAADGKKFRNYAQQTTLDVLLAYANQHLHQLARRYRLQRIRDSLGLMVIDQDMGDENRSVHSLSGGESFLVSLALALGLASLSSNRVKVESLFIDEGFGSLDADTLRVAMDALDSLQAQGRKVGVISHVQEMTERIATKIMVQRTAGGRSLVGVG